VSYNSVYLWVSFFVHSDQAIFSEPALNVGRDAQMARYVKTSEKAKDLIIWWFQGFEKNLGHNQGPLHLALFQRFDLVLILHLILGPARQPVSFAMVATVKQPGGFEGSGVDEIDPQ
jgi:hypothetical protein